MTDIIEINGKRVYGNKHAISQLENLIQRAGAQKFRYHMNNEEKAIYQAIISQIERYLIENSITDKTNFEVYKSYKIPVHVFEKLFRDNLFPLESVTQTVEILNGRADFPEGISQNDVRNARNRGFAVVKSKKDGKYYLIFRKLRDLVDDNNRRTGVFIDERPRLTMGEFEELGRRFPPSEEEKEQLRKIRMWREDRPRPSMAEMEELERRFPPSEEEKEQLRKIRMSKEERPRPSMAEMEELERRFHPSEETKEILRQVRHLEDRPRPSMAEMEELGRRFPASEEEKEQLRKIRMLKEDRPRPSMAEMEDLGRRFPPSEETKEILRQVRGHKMIVKKYKMNV